MALQASENFRNREAHNYLHRRCKQKIAAERRNQMKVELEGKVAVVTGGANGIGRSTVDALIENGAQVAIVDIDTQAGMKTAEEIKEMGGTCLFVEGNVSDAAQMEAVAAQIAAHFGKIEILINNAGINTRK